MENPVYATTKFFAALTRVHGYATMPVYWAVQYVQHSADGSAYEQWAYVAGQLADYFTGQPPHGVSCWYPPSGPGDLTGAVRQMAQTFGPPGRKGVVIRVTTDRSVQKNSGSDAVLHVERSAAWTVADWLVAHAQAYGLNEVRYAGYQWKAADGSMGWQPDPGPNASPRGSIVAG